MIPLKIATCRPLPEADVDEQLLLDALRAEGIDARLTPWREDVDSEDATPTIIRSTWDYIHHVPDFFAGRKQYRYAPRSGIRSISFDAMRTRVICSNCRSVESR